MWLKHGAPAGPRCSPAGRRADGGSAPFEHRRAFGQEGVRPSSVVVGGQKIEGGAFFFGREGVPSSGDAPLLCQRATSGAPFTMRPAVARASCSTSSSSTRVSRPLARASRALRMRPSSRIQAARRGRRVPAGRPSRPDTSKKPSLLIGAPKRLDSPGDADVAAAGDLHAAADAGAWIIATVGTGQARMASEGGGHEFLVIVQGVVHGGAHDQELLDVAAGREGLVAGAAQHHAAQVGVGVKFAHAALQAAPHAGIDGVEFVRVGEGQGGDASILAERISPGMGGRFRRRGSIKLF